MDQKEFHVLNAAGRLPSPKGVALQLMRLIHRETASIDDIAKTIKSDPALVGRVLAAANASANHRGRRYLSVHEALTVIGTSVTYRLALGLSIISNTRDGRCRQFNYGHHWLHSVLVALAMQGLTVRTRVSPGEDSFSFGLMHRIGRLGLATLYPEEYGAILARQSDRGTALAAQRAAFATDENELGQHMLANWGFPEAYVEAIALVDSMGPDDVPEDSRVSRIARQLRVADGVAECGIGGDFAAMAGDDLTALAAPLDLTSDDLRDVWNEVAAAWPTWRELLDLDGLELPRLDAAEPAREGAPSSSPGVAAASASPAPASTPDDRLRVLTMTVDPSVSRLIRSVLDPETTHVDFVAGDDDALRAAITAVPQLLILDWTESMTDGLQICRTLRASAVFRSAYIIVLCGDSDGSTAVRAIDAGADDCVPRKVAPDVLVARLGVARRAIALQKESEHEREGVRRQASELGIANRRLQELALMDPLTGLPNRRYADDHMDKEWAAAGSNGEPLSCLMIDVDKFKMFNDKFGHDVGDAVLTHLASILRAHIRTNDTVCRIGGEEFLVVCRNTTRESGQQCAERLRAAVQATPLVIGRIRHAVTVSVGVAFADNVVPDPPALRMRADEALYCAKRQGRNRVAVL